MATFHPDESFEAFERRLGLDRVSLSKRQAAERLGISERSVDELVRTGELPAYRLGQQKLSFLGSDLARLLWARRLPVSPKPPRQHKPRTPGQLTPPRRRGRRPKVTRDWKVM
jgi:excisionase family DNA binding protein